MRSLPWPSVRGRVQAVRKKGSAQQRVLLWPPFQAGGGFCCRSSKGLTQLEEKQGPLPGSILE